MATITKRKDCKSDVWRVQIRSHNVPTYSKNFKSYSEAKDWVDKNEHIYKKYPEKYILNNKNEENIKKDFINTVKNFFSPENFSMEKISEATNEIFSKSQKYKPFS